MEVLVLDGKSYVKASKAARDLGYATDYVGQLCRTGQVDAHLIGRTWYVDREQLGTHRVEKKRMSRTKAREQAKKLIIAQRGTSVSMKGEKATRNIAISYEGDESPLIPETRKLAITTERPRYVMQDEEDEQETIIENKGAKIQMSGGLKVVDVTDEPIDDNVTVLRPTLIRSRPVEISHDETPVSVVKERQPESRRILAIDDSHTEQEEPVFEEEEPHSADPVPFAERLAELTTAPEPQDTVKKSYAPIRTPVASDESGGKYSYFMHFFLLVVVLVGVLASFALSTTLEYDTNRVEMIRFEWVFSVEEAITRFSERF
jgi:hypothetical protein